MKELLGAHSQSECTDEQTVNLTILLDRLNKVRVAWGKPMTITSGLRNDADMERIYKSKKYPRMSKHLFGQAADISDPKLELYNWLIANDCAMLKKYNLWMEKGTTNWVHVQIVPMASYNLKTDIRVFNP
jgi:uncharacterized protein YcbK (DUF882 family)